MEIYIFLVGLAVGSFVNVLADRWSIGESILGRSHCDHCKKTITWYDLFPVVSYVLLKARCRNCHKKLSLQYPLVEAITGLVFLAVFLIHKYTHPTGIDAVYLLYQLIIVTSLVVIFVADLKYRIIPDEANIVIGLSAILFLLLKAPQNIGLHVAAAAGVAGLFLFLALVTSGKGMGMGDVKYVFVAGLLMGLPNTIIALYLAFLTGAVFSLILIVFGKKSMKSTIAFGPFLTIATLVTFIYGDTLWRLSRIILGV